MANTKTMLNTASADIQTIIPGEDNNFYNEDKKKIEELRSLSRPSFIQGDIPYTNLGKYGVGESKYDKDITSVNAENLQNIRAERQGPIAQFGSFLNQALVGEIIGGTIEGIGYLGSLNEFNKLIEGEDREFGNAWSNAGKTIREWSRRETPIYEYKEREGQFRPWDWSWWMTNGPSIASSLSLMIPSGAIAAIPTAIAKGVGVGAKAARKVMGVSQAIVSRYMENMMEASGTFEEIRNQMISQGKTEEEATQLAAKGAQKTYVADWAMLVQDIPQYMFLNNALSNVVSNKGKSLLGETVNPILNKGTFNFIKNQLGESLEEGYQFLAGDYGKYFIEKQLNPSLKTPFIDKAKDAFKEGEIWTNMFFGAIGAGVMQSASGLNAKFRGIEDESVTKIKSQAQLFSAISSEIIEARNENNPIKEKLAESKLISNLYINAAVNNSLQHTESLIDSIVNEDFTTENLERLGITEEQVAPFRGVDNKAKVASLKEVGKKTVEKYESALKDIKNSKTTLGKGFEKAYKNRDPLYSKMDRDSYATLLAGTITQTSMTRESIDNSIKELELAKQKLNTDIKNNTAPGKSFNELSPFGKSKLLADIDLDAEQLESDSFRKRYSEDNIKDSSEAIKTDILKQFEYYDKRIEALKEISKAAGELLEDQDKEIMKNLNMEDLKEARINARNIAQLKADSHAYSAMEARLATGNLVTDAEINKYYDDYYRRNEDTEKQFGFKPNDIVFIPSLNKEGIVESVEKTEDKKNKYTISTGTFDSLGMFNKDGSTNVYDLDDLQTSGYNTPTDVYQNLETLSSSENVDSDYDSKFRNDLKDGRKNKPITTLADNISYIHIDVTKPSKVEIRDKKLDEFVSKPGIEIEEILAKGSTTYRLDLDNAYWTNPKDTPKIRKQKTELKDKLNIIFSSDTTPKEKKRLSKELIKYFESTPVPETDEGWSYLIDTIPIRIIVMTGGRIFSDELYVHDSDFWNLKAPASTEENPIDPVAYKKAQREETRMFRLAIIEQLMAGKPYIVNGIRREGGHLNRVATLGAIHDRIKIDLKDLVLWVALNDKTINAGPNESVIYPTTPGSILYRTNKTMHGNSVSIAASVANMSSEHADILLNAIITLNTPGLGRRSEVVIETIDPKTGFPIYTKDERVEGVNASEVIDLLTFYGNATNTEGKSINQRLFMDENLMTLHYGEIGKINDIFSITKKERSDFIKWAKENKKYHVPLKVKTNNFNLNSHIPKSFKIGSIINEDKDGKGYTWAQVLASTVVSTTKKANVVHNIYAVSTNIELNSNGVVDGKPVLLTGNTSQNNSTEGNDTIEKTTPPLEPVVAPTEEVKEEKKTPPKRSRLKNGPALGSNKLPSMEYSEKLSKEPKISKEEKDWFASRFPGKTTEEVNKLITLLNNGRQAFGVFRASAISLYKGAPIGTLYHEAFHRVSLGYLSKEEREKYYNVARKKYNIIGTKDSVVEERLANEFRAWKINNTEDIKLYTSVTPWIRRLYDFIVYFFTGSNRIKDYEIDNLFKEIDKGRYSDRFIGLRRRLELKDYEAPYEVASLLGRGRVNMPEINSYKEFTNFIKGLTTILIQQSNVVSLKQYKNINLKYLFDYIKNNLLDKVAENETETDGFRTIQSSLAYDIENNIIEEGETIESLKLEKDKVDRIVRLFDSVLSTTYMPIYVKYINGMLRSQYGISTQSNVFEDDEDWEFSVLQKSEGDRIAEYSKASYEIDVRDNASSNIKFLIATIRESDEINEITRTYDYVNFNDMWNSVLHILHDKNTIEEMMETLALKAKQSFPYNDLYTKLNEGKERLRTQFKVVVNKYKHAYVNVTHGRSGKGYSFEILRSDINREEKNEVRRWAYNFFESDYFKEYKGRKILVDKKYNDLIKKWDTLLQNVTQDLADNKTSSKKFKKSLTNTYENAFLSFLSEFGIESTSDVFKYIIETKNNKESGIYANTLGTYIVEKGTELMRMLKDVRESQATIEDYNVFGNIFAIFESPKKVGAKPSAFVIKDLANTKYVLNPDLLNNIVIGPEGHQYYTYSPNSYATEQIKKLRDETYLDTLLNKQYHKYSYFVNQLKNDPDSRNKITFRTFSAWQERNANDKGTSYTNLNDIEDYMLRLVVFQNSLLALPVLADRSTYQFVDGLKLPKIRYDIKNGEPTLPDNIIDIFVNYAKAERDRITDANELADKYDAANRKERDRILEEEMVENYHYIRVGLSGKPIVRPTKEGEKGGNAYKYIEFKSFNRKGFDFDRDARNEIISFLEGIISEGIKHAESLNIIRRTDQNSLETNYLDLVLLDTMQRELGTGGNKAPIDLAIRNTIMENEILMAMSNFETNMLFVGDPAFYKIGSNATVQEDRIKRLGVLTSSGDNYDSLPVTYGNNNEYFNLSILQTQKINMDNASQFDRSSYENLEKTLVLNYANILLNDLKNRDEKRWEPYKDILKGELDTNRIHDILKKEFDLNIKDLLEPYRNIDPTDGQGYITPFMYRAMLDKHGEWTEEMEEAYKIMENKSIEDMTQDEFAKISKLAMGPLKPVFFDLIDTGDILIPLYLKLSVAVLWPNMIKNTHMQDLYDRMTLTGKYKDKENIKPIHMSVYDSGVKVGRRASIKLHKNADRKDVNDLGNIATYTTPFASLRKQIVTDPHDVAETKMGTQFAKIGLAGLQLYDSVYEFGGEKLTGLEIAKIIFSSLGSISDKGLVELKQKLGWNDNDKSIDLKELTKTLREDAIRSGTADLIADSFRLEGEDLFLELDSMPNKRQISSRIIGMVNKYCIDTLMPGNAFIQMSDYGLATSPDKELKWYTLNEAGQLTAAECKISINMFKHIIPNYEDLTPEQARNWVLNEKPEILAYRIPTQSQASVIYLKVVDVFEESMGDTILLPSPVTALTGSDFDIDKMYAIRHNYQYLGKGKSEKIRFGNTPEEVFEYQTSNIINTLVNNIDRLERIYKIDPERFKGNKVDTIKTKIQDMREKLYPELYEQIKSDLDYLEDNVEMDSASLSTVTMGIMRDMKDIIKFWNLKELREDFVKKNEGKSPYEYNTVGAIKNQLFEAYLSIYRSKEHLIHTQLPLGGLTKKLKDLAKLIEEDNQDNDLYVYSATHQNKLKFQYNGGQKGIAPFALNNVHHILSQLANLKYEGDSLGLLKEEKEGGRTVISLYDNLGKDNLSILSWLSAMIDAHVDLAKDNYIMKLNVNEITYNVVSLLLRGGMGLDTFKFLSQPILKEFARAAINSGKGRLSMYYNETHARNEIKSKWENLLSEEGKRRYESDKQIGWFDDNVIEGVMNKCTTPYDEKGTKYYYNLKLSDITDTKLKDTFIIDQLRIYDMYIHFSYMASDLGNFVQLSQIDTKKYGKTTVEVIHYNKRLLDFIKSNKFRNEKKLLPTENIVTGDSFLGHYYRNSVGFLLEILPKLTIYASPVFMKALGSILDLSNNANTLDKRFINSVADELYATIIGEFFHNNIIKYNDDVKADESLVAMWNNVVDYIGKIQSKKLPESELLSNNSVIKAFSKIPVATEVKLPIKYFLGTAKKAFADKLSNDDYMYDWLDMLNADTSTPEGKRIASFARRLFVFSFYNSGFRNRLHSFFNIIPPDLIKDFEVKPGEETVSLNDFIKAKRELFSNPVSYTGIENTIDEVFVNNTQNRDLVPSIFEGNKVDNLANVFTEINVTPLSKSPNAILIDTKGIVAAILNPMQTWFFKGDDKKTEHTSIKSNLYLGDNIEGDPIYTKYVTMFQIIGRFAVKPHTMKYIGYYKTTKEEPIDVKDSEGKTVTKIKYITEIHPIYKTIKRKSYDKGGITYREYWFDKSGIEENNEIEVMEYDTREGEHKQRVVELTIPDGEELLYFNNKYVVEPEAEGSIGFTEGKNIKIITDFNIDSAKSMSTLFSGRGASIQRLVEMAENEEKETLSNKWEWARTSDNGYEVSTKGDKRFSALVAKLPDGRTIEEHYQVDIKGYKTIEEGKGKPPINVISREESWNSYKNLWIQWASNNPQLMEELVKEAKGRVLTDMFAWGEVSQARALAEILNEKNINFIEDTSTNYRNRTFRNASADATIAIAIDFDTAGEKATKDAVKKQNKLYIPIFVLNGLDVKKDVVDEIVDELNDVNAITLNIAGNGLYTLKGLYTQEQIDNYVYELLKQIIESPKLINKIVSVNTGGQTGFDEAGAKAAIKLGIKDVTIIAPKDWKFRNEKGVDISNERQFKERFGTIVEKQEIKNPSAPTQLKMFDQPELTLSQLKDKINNKYKDKPNFVPLTLKDIVHMSKEEIDNLLNC